MLLIVHSNICVRLRICVCSVFKYYTRRMTGNNPRDAALVNTVKSLHDLLRVSTFFFSKFNTVFSGAPLSVVNF